MPALPPPDAAAPDAAADAAQAVRRRRLLFRARLRGTHENDLLLGRFARAHLAAMTEAELAAFEAILDLPDPDLFDWITGRAAVPAEHDSALLRRLIADAGGQP